MKREHNVKWFDEADKEDHEVHVTCDYLMDAEETGEVEERLSDSRNIASIYVYKPACTSFVY